MLFYYVFIGLLAVSLATKNVTDTKDKRQITQTRVLPSLNQQSQPIYGHRESGQYVTRPRQVLESGQQSSQQLSEQEQQLPQDYYNFVQGIVLQQQQNDAAAANQEAIQRSQAQNHHKHHRQPQASAALKQPQYVELPEHLQYSFPSGPEPPNEQRILSEEEYLELIKKTEAATGQKYSSFSATPTASQPQQPQQSANQSPGLGHYKKNHKEPSARANNAHSAYRTNSYANPLGDFSLEKELAKLEASNKAILNHGQNEDESDSQNQRNEESVKSSRYSFKPSLQLNPHQKQSSHHHAIQPQPTPSQQQYSFLSPDYSGYSSQTQKLVAGPYGLEPSGAGKSVDQGEHQIQYISPSSEPEHRQHPSNLSPKYQYVIANEPAQYQGQLLQEQYEIQSQIPKASPVKIIAPPQLQYERPQQSYNDQQSPIHQYYKNHPIKAQQQVQPANNHNHQPLQHHQGQPQAHSHQKPAPQLIDSPAPSRSTIFVSQTTGLKQKPEKPQQQSPNVVRLPPPNQKRPLTQAEFQALVDAGYKVQAIPVPVPVPVSIEKYNQVLQQQQQQQQSQPQYQQVQYERAQQSAADQYQPQYAQQQQQQQQPSPQQSHRPQPSNKHYVRYQPAQTQQQQDSILSSYLRPLFSSLVGGGGKGDA